MSDFLPSGLSPELREFLETLCEGELEELLLALWDDLDDPNTPMSSADET